MPEVIFEEYFNGMGQLLKQTVAAGIKPVVASCYPNSGYCRAPAAVGVARAYNVHQARTAHPAVCVWRRRRRRRHGGVCVCVGV